jgi:hypothetical protein
MHVTARETRQLPAAVPINERSSMCIVTVSYPSINLIINLVVNLIIDGKSLVARDIDWKILKLFTSKETATQIAKSHENPKYFQISSATYSSALP